MIRVTEYSPVGDICQPNKCALRARASCLFPPATPEARSVNPSTSNVEGGKRLLGHADR